MRWCLECNQGAEIILPPVCQKCGQSLDPSQVGTRCQEILPSLHALRSWAYFGGSLREAIHRLKYKRDMALGEALSRPMIACLDSLGWPVDMVIPVPLGVARFKERGYNQATLLALPIALWKGLPFRPYALSRVRETRSQVDLNVVERKINVTGAFLARREWVVHRNILLVDDVATTGSTLEACAAALLHAGADRVFGLTLARAHFKTGTVPGEPVKAGLVSVNQSGSLT